MTTWRSERMDSMKTIRIEDIRNREEERQRRQRMRFVSKASATSAKYMRRMEELSGAPSSMKPFFDVLKKVYVDMEDPFEGMEIPTVGTFCVMAPQELIYAAGAQPVKLCSGSYTAFAIGDDIVPRDACPLVKAVEGFREIGVMPVYRNASMMVVPITCDCKKKIAGLLEERLEHDGKKSDMEKGRETKCSVHTMHVPVTRDDRAIDQFVSALYELCLKLEESTGNRITRDRLIFGMRMVGQAQYELSRFLKLKKVNPYLIRGTHAIAIMNAASYMNAADWANALHDLNDELVGRVALGTKVTARAVPRILITGSPVIFPNMKIPLLIEEMGGHMAADETCMGERGMSDPAVPVDDSFDGCMRALANRALRPCSCPTFAENSERIYRIRQMIRDYDIQGVVYHVLRGCLVYDFEYKQIEEELGKIGIPVIRLESDYNEEDVEQLRIRVEAFIELIRLSENSGEAAGKQDKQNPQGRRVEYRWKEKGGIAG